MKLLQNILGDKPLNDFLDHHFTKIPYSSTGGASDYLDLLNWKVVESILKTKKSVLRIVKDGRVLKDYVDLNFEEAKKFHQEGATLLVRYAEKSHGALMAVAKDFAGSFRTDVDIQLYCTPDGHNAFGWHYDVEEVFIIQTQGSKHYTIRPNTVHPNPLITSIPKNLGYELEKTPIEIQVTLKPGDWLYIPSGWWHVAETKEDSMHISIGLMPSSAVDIVSFLPQFLAKSPFWRTRMPIHKNFENIEEEILFYQDTIIKLGKEVEKHFSSKEFIEEFINYKKQDALKKLENT